MLCFFDSSSATIHQVQGAFMFQTDEAEIHKSSASVLPMQNALREIKIISYLELHFNQLYCPGQIFPFRRVKTFADTNELREPVWVRIDCGVVTNRCLSI